MSPRDIIVIGASAGGINALQTVMSGVPKDLPASMFAVVHIPPLLTSNLPRILNHNCGSCLPAIHPKDGQPIERGHLYIAPPDHHLLVEPDCIQVWRGPKENSLRPAINPLFRSAAVAYRNRAIGVVLSGTLDDGSTGLLWIKRFGGIAVVQDPKDAIFPDMPRNAMEHVQADYIVPAAEIGPLLARLVKGQSEAVPPQER